MWCHFSKILFLTWCSIGNIIICAFKVLTELFSEIRGKNVLILFPSTCFWFWSSAGETLQNYFFEECMSIFPEKCSIYCRFSNLMKFIVIWENMDSFADDHGFCLKFLWKLDQYLTCEQDHRVSDVQRLITEINWFWS